MTVSTLNTKYHHPCGCARGAVTVVRREPIRGGVGAPTIIRNEIWGDHDPNRTHVLRVPVRAWSSDKWPGKP